MKVTDLRVCYVSPEFFHWGVHGGFGYVTWTLSRKLVDRGVEVCVVTPRRKGQRPVEEVDGVKVVGYDAYEGYPYPAQVLASRVRSRDAYREAAADIYHSQAVSFNTLAAESAAPGRLHLITFQDPYDGEEWRRIAQVEPRYRMSPMQWARIVAERCILTEACRRADGLYTQARFLAGRARRLFKLREPPAFLPNPVPVPEKVTAKSDQPTVCFLARWDPQKRVELFLRLARRFPEVRFIAMGRGHDPQTDTELREAYRGTLNLTMTGFVSEELKSRVLAESWALVNTSVREALPVSFLEALAHETPIVSGENPDGLTRSYGYHVAGDDYASALKTMLEDPNRGRKGREGRRLVKEVYEADRVAELHLKVYRRHIEGQP
jgi:glycosyltransferase involved in cell wall biosynthesis